MRKVNCTSETVYLPKIRRFPSRKTFLNYIVVEVEYAACAACRRKKTRKSLQNHNLFWFKLRWKHCLTSSFVTANLTVSCISVLCRWPTVVHHYQEHDGGRRAGGICSGLWLTAAASEPHVTERGHVPGSAAGQHPAPATAGCNGLHPAYCHR